ncbi:DUF4054 domain-containing protein [Campylobacter ureolyticus]|uniref:DUF4054 domain-containing protein n=1 Tax=Campylobacter ureolyticus TaxID=827 RepID=UPI00290F768C|nr:DUF4054 domain-containing protein [Campylobacter ureolyticus]MDU7070072.1 DUF4054 domain-containing protein [Campylobacter ureolyticus]
MDFKSFIERFDEFKDVSEVKINHALDDAKLQISSKAWGTFYEVGVYNLTAHILASSGALGGDSGNFAPIKEATSKTVGALSIGYASAKTGFENTKGGYYLTKYGQRYLELLRLVSLHIGVVR